MTNRLFLLTLQITMAWLGGCSVVNADERPNVILIMTDDQGYGDFGFNGNPVIETPNLDAMAARCLMAKTFYVCPVCAPTRACLLTGRYNYRTGVVDTYQGRAMMHSDETTIAELMSAAGYSTGIFGKWHLGDCYPLRPGDQGFQRSVVHRGGGIGQSSDPLEAEGKYTNPILIDDGTPKQFEGFCTDVYYREATRFIEDSVRAKKPFFVYLPDNCPHSPFHDVTTKWYDKYKDMDLSNEAIPNSAENPLPKKTNVDQRARIYSMISNIDENIGRLQQTLKNLNVADNTIVIFLTDNGPNGQRYVAGLRGMKTSVYQGGIRTPLLVQWPAKIKKANQILNRLAHIDLLPTLCEICDLPIPTDRPIDGLSFASALNRQTDGTIQLGQKFQDRTIFIQTHRGNVPLAFHHFAAIGPRYKLVHHSGFQKERFDGTPKLELFDLQSDPGETTDLAASEPDIAEGLRQNYLRWFDEMRKTRNGFEPPRIIIGNERENPTWLTRQDARRDTSDRGENLPFLFWQLTAETAGNYDLVCHFKQIDTDNEEIELRVDDKTWTSTFDLQSKTARFDNVSIAGGDFQLSVASKNETRKPYPRQAYQIELNRTE